MVTALSDSSDIVQIILSVIFVISLGRLVWLWQATFTSGVQSVASCLSHSVFNSDISDKPPSKWVRKHLSFTWFGSENSVLCFHCVQSYQKQESDCFRTPFFWCIKQVACLFHLKCLWHEKYFLLIWKAFQNTEEWCFSFWIIFFVLEILMFFYYANEISDDVILFASKNGKILNKLYLWKYQSSVPETWHHTCASQKKHNDTFNVIAMATVWPLVLS